VRKRGQEESTGDGNANIRNAAVEAGVHELPPPPTASRFPGNYAAWQVFLSIFIVNYLNAAWRIGSGRRCGDFED
jgi:hypothetical protein